MGKEMIEYTSGRIRLAFTTQTGEICHLSFTDGESVVGYDTDGCSVDVRLGWERWLSQDHTPQVVGHEEDESGVCLSLRFGPILIRDKYHIEGDRIERQIGIQNDSQGEVQLTGVRLHLRGVQISDPEDCTFEAPASVIRSRLPLDIAARQSIGGPYGKAFAPGAPERFGRAIEDAPDVTPGLLAVHNHAHLESILVWYFSEVEAGSPMVFGDGRSLNLGHEIHLAGWMFPGEELVGGTQFIQLHRGEWNEALETFRGTYQRVGIEPPIYDKPPPWVREAAVYEVHPGPFGGFRGLASQLPCIRAMGHTVLYLMPVMTFDNRSGVAWDENWLGSGSPYAMKDFEAFEPTLGTEEDFKALVEKAHKQGMKILMDFVTQGCAIDARYVQEHPEWFSRDESGNLVSSHGWVDTYSFDWANPEFQAYMLDWALRFVRAYGIDGYRVDAPHGKEPNWDRSIPYHASRTNLGVLSLLEKLRLGIKQIEPEAALLCELFGPVFVKTHDFQCDYYPFANLYALLRGEISPYEFGEWLQDYWAVMPPSAIRVSFTETHDTRTEFSAYAWRGSVAEKAMYAILVMAGFVPMMWAGQEVGSEDFYRRVLFARSQCGAILFGERLFNAVSCDNPDVLSIITREGEETIWGVVSLYAERTPLTFDLSAVFEIDSSRTYRLHDLITQEDWVEYGQKEWTAETLQSVTLSLVPYVPYFFKIDS